MKVQPSFFCLALIVLAATSVSSQTKQRTVFWSENQVNYANAIGRDSQPMAQIEALEIIDVRVGDKPIMLGDAFAAGDDWLKSLTVRIKNVSNLTIKTVQMNLFLPELMPGGPMLHLCFGCGLIGTDETIAPGEEVDLKLAFYKWVVETIEKKSSLPMITKAEIWDFRVTLEDGKSWIISCMKTANPKNACPTRER